MTFALVVYYLSIVGAVLCAVGLVVCIVDAAYRRSPRFAAWFGGIFEKVTGRYL